MGFLDELKRQAEAVKTQNHVDIAALDRNTALTEVACKGVLQYFVELAPQLNVLQLKPKQRFSLDSRTPIEGLSRGEFRVDARRKQLRSDEVHDFVVMHGMQRSGTLMTMSKDFPPEIERLEARLRQAGITPDTETRRDQSNGRLQHVAFKFVADIVVQVKMVPDHDNARVSFQLLNLDGLETVTAKFGAAAVTSGLLDELARSLAGESSQFLKLAETIKRIEP
ncbi:MAG: hypothetical protein RLZZ618_1141 [Pseudomonadota bacterium]|jgi:hypothetical protein